ncbi:rhodanese-like protein [Rhizobium phaseoli]|nr:rhodanese-like protein [Rhizobium phaseoli]
MPSFLEITSDKLSRIVGTPGAPALIDVRIDEDFNADPRLVPGSQRLDYRTVEEWESSMVGPVVIICPSPEYRTIPGGRSVSNCLRVGGFSRCQIARRVSSSSTIIAVPTSLI